MARRWRLVSGSASTPAQDAVEADAKALSAAWEGWGHRKLAELKRVGIDDVAAVRQAAGARRESFICPPVRRNRLWQADLSEFETAAGGRWNLGGVVDYWAKVNVACEVSVTKTTSDAIAVLEAALADVDALLGVSWVTDLTDPATGEIGTLRLVTDNGSCFTSGRFGAWIATKRHIAHIRTRRRAPWTNGAIERFFAAIKDEHLYRQEITTGVDLADHVAGYRAIYNTIRPHEAIAMRRLS